MSKDKHITPYNEKNQRHGLWEVYYFGGKLMFKCFFHNGKEIGYEEQYFNNGGKLSEKKYFL